MSDDKRIPLGPGLGLPKPRSELRHWSTYKTAGEFYDDYAGHVPLAMMVGISRLQHATGMSFADAYRTLFERGAIIHIDETRTNRRRPKRSDPPSSGRARVARDSR